MEEAVGTNIAWPRDLIIEANKTDAPVIPTKKVKFCVIVRITKVLCLNMYVCTFNVFSTFFFLQGDVKAVKKWNNVMDCAAVEYVVEMGPDYPSSLKRLWLWAKDALSDGWTITFNMCREAFGSTKKQCLFLSDVHALCTRGEISASIICIYIK